MLSRDSFAWNRSIKFHFRVYISDSVATHLAPNSCILAPSVRVGFLSFFLSLLYTVVNLLLPKCLRKSFLYWRILLGCYQQKNSGVSPILRITNQTCFGFLNIFWPVLQSVRFMGQRFLRILIHSRPGWVQENMEGLWFDNGPFR